MSSTASAEIAAAAARLVVEDGMEYGAAKRKAARDLGRRTRRRGPRDELPSHEAVEDEVRQYIGIFCADTQPGELRALRALALLWMRRLAPFRPHLSGAVWRGTATRQSAIHLDLYCDDPKSAEIALIDAGVDYDVASIDRAGREPVNVLLLATPCPALRESVTVQLALHDRDDQRGALRPDTRGRSWRGDLAAVQRLLEPDA
jgi:hypothetical protein